MDSLTLEEVKKAKSFRELENKYIPNLTFTLGEKDRNGENIIYKYSRVCARTVYSQIFLFHKRNEYGKHSHNIDTSEFCKSSKDCGNTHIDIKYYNKLSFCAVYLVKGKCRFGIRDCKYLHIFDDTKYSTSNPISSTPSPILSPNVTSTEYKPPPIQIPTFSECQECVNPLSTSETQQLNTRSSTSETQHRFSYPIEDYWKDLAKITAEKNQFERQLNNLYSEYQNEKIHFERQLNNVYSEYQIEIMKLKSELKNVTDKATRDREYYKEKLEYFQFLISRNSRYDEHKSGRESERERERYRYY
jgi:hypothetical protein